MSIGRIRFLSGLLALAALTVIGAVFPCPAMRGGSTAETRIIKKKQLLFSDDFRAGLSGWQTELEAGGRVQARGGLLDIDVPAGATVWLRSELNGSVLIEYDAFMVRAGGVNDWVSDLNCFWMAQDPRREVFLSPPRSGKFADYNALLTYYVGLGGNRNSTTRFRRYIGDDSVRPLLPENNLTAPETLLQPNRWQHIRLVADGSKIQYYRDGLRLFGYSDPQPYTHGYFGLRTTKSHLQVRRLRIYRLGD